MRIQIYSAPTFPFPASRGTIRLKVNGFDFAWALLSPPFALWLSNAYILNTPAASSEVFAYCLLTSAASAIALLIFHVNDGVARYFSVHDALAIGKAVVSAEILGCVLMFTATRLEGIPRSAPVIHALLFGAGLLFARMFMRIAAHDLMPAVKAAGAREHVILIGANELSAFYIKLLQSCAPDKLDVVAVLDGRQSLFGRAIEGVRIVGAAEHLDSILTEYAVHGIEVSRVIVAGDVNLLTPIEIGAVRAICDRRKISFDILPRLLNLQDSAPGVQRSVPFADRTTIAISPYFKWKRTFDVVMAALLLVILLPVLVGVSLAVMADSGLPVLFWQQRIGMHGSRFLLYKFRTLRPPFDWKGLPIAADQRLSKSGQILRELSLDELPQLLNIFVGDMSLIGPRPLLPEDQPKDPRIRLAVRPGITGWAQINGGKLLSPEEKEALDEWYVMNASPLVDLKIVFKTIGLLLLRSRAREGAADKREIISRKSTQEVGSQSHS